ncbi:bifunctional riboflavin kinase/FAD synthetase [Blochmannia endosymbiont of Polyrhachis (Hedomyrma) turneri]|uniref:bifunctional riboflavin kinase/FAD synthetase n=1 Tax=Blochmannia endosymbiont of Polyrhachis (Hedomyrma) turneri TaxID=1505596 RepID=UPI00061A80E1|nr:bifunctional riboflavin kinase/FAD synthetase [Blochmannia endosymbiont of Polyrhachis (Hedomyrma) turneri]AKC59701.1 Riboflavin biosynthesis protein ribF [Blochmannia endosymbiont of Polyrhachis (Hedomyrma) turneri]
MEFIRGIHNLRSCHRGCALTIGNFDGFHRGHQLLILKLQQIGINRGLPIMVMIFEPQPQEYFFGMSVRLTSLRDKVKYLSNAGIDMLLCVFFNAKFSSLSPCAFISDILVKKLNVRLIYIGDNFCFGANRQGNFNFLKKMSYNFGFEVMKINTCIDNCGDRISSTAIRNALVEDRLGNAEILLGHVYSISGRVMHGSQLGTFIGFPTLNISLKKSQRLPINGVYAVEVYGISDHLSLLGVANIGNCPTVHRFRQPRLEVYLLDHVIDVYGCYIQVLIRAKIRNEQKFSSISELRDQIKYDVMNVRKYFNSK